MMGGGGAVVVLDGFVWEPFFGAFGIIQRFWEWCLDRTGLDLQGICQGIATMCCSVTNNLEQTKYLFALLVGPKERKQNLSNGRSSN